MKNYNKLPLKERKRHLEYSFKHEERLEEQAIKALIKDKESSYSEKTDKDRECEEVYKRLKELMEDSDGNNR